jgi:hypothetical protein
MNPEWQAAVWPATAEFPVFGRGVSEEVATLPVWWDDSTMSEFSPDHGPHLHAHSAPTTQQMRTVGQRRRDAEEKLEQHLQEARHKDHLHGSAPVTLSTTTAADQNDGGLPDGEGVDPNPGR